MKQTSSTIGLPLINPDFDTSEYQRNIYAIYKSWQLNNPIFENNEGVIYLTKYQDCLTLLTSNDFVRQTEHGSPFRKHGTLTPLEKTIADWMVYQDAPKHGYLRHNVAQYFTPKNIQQLEQTAYVISERLIKNILNKKQPIDFIQAFSFALPIEIICTMLGVNCSDKTFFMEWSSAISTGLNSGKEAELLHSTEAMTEITHYFKSLLPLRRKNLGDDLISVLLQTNLNDDEIISSCIFIIWAGHETTKLVITSLLKLLSDNPNAWQTLKQNPHLIANAAEEAVRMESAVQKLSRWSACETTLSGISIPKGRQVVALIGAANRDPDIFENPDQFLLSRTSNKHLGFGKGMHHCLGISLARMEAKVALTVLLDNLQSFKLEQFNYRPLSAFRALDTFAISTIKE